MPRITLLFFYLLLIHLSSQAQWTLVGSAFSGTIRGIYFTSPDTGYAVGSFGSISKTTDGGTTWTPQTSGTSVLLRDVMFVNHQTGYVCGADSAGTGTVLKTTNGGDTWTSSASGVTSYCRSVNFATTSIGFLGGAAGVIYKTTDSGNTWTSYNLGILSDVIQLQMIDANTGYAIAAKNTYDSGYIFKTTNGGGSWTQVYSDAAIGFLALAVADNNTVYAAGESNTIVKTTNGGLNWSTVKTGVAGYRYRDAFALSATEVYMTDDHAVISHTANGGAAWNDTLIGTSLGLYSIYFPTAAIGYAGDYEGNVYKLSLGCDNLPPAPDAITGLDSVCSGSTEQFSIDAVGGADFYTWSGPSDAIITSGQGTTQVMITFGELPGQISVTSQSALCGAGGSISINIVMNPSPSPAITFSDSVLLSSAPVGNQWYFNGSAIGGATDSTYTPLLSGTYYVVVTNNFGCTGTSNSIDVIGVGINSTPGFSLAIFPNPSVDASMIYFSEIMGGELRIINTKGVIEFSENNLSGREYKLNTSLLTSGFYLIQIYNRENNLIASSRLIVQ